MNDDYEFNLDDVIRDIENAKKRLEEHHTGVEKSKRLTSDRGSKKNKHDLPPWIGNNT